MKFHRVKFRDEKLPNINRRACLQFDLEHCFHRQIVSRKRGEGVNGNRVLQLHVYIIMSSIINTLHPTSQVMCSAICQSIEISIKGL